MGATIAYILIQHKAELGIKHVTEITIFRDDGPETVGVDVQMIFKIKDVPNPGDVGMVDTDSALHVRDQATLDLHSRNIIRVHRVFPDK
jgi:hypothetical protein